MGEAEKWLMSLKRLQLLVTDHKGVHVHQQKNIESSFFFSNPIDFS
jgi:hypothetical protein